MMTVQEAIEVIEGIMNSVNANRATWKRMEEAYLVLKKMADSQAIVNKVVENLDAKNSH